MTTRKIAPCGHPWMRITGVPGSTSEVWCIDCQRTYGPDDRGWSWPEIEPAIAEDR
jgi:hypothetical protein